MSKNPQWAGIHNLDSLDQMQTIEVDPVSRERRHKGNELAPVNCLKEDCSRDAFFCSTFDQSLIGPEKFDQLAIEKEWSKIQKISREEAFFKQFIDYV